MLFSKFFTLLQRGFSTKREKNCKKGSPESSSPAQSRHNSSIQHCQYMQTHSISSLQVLPLPTFYGIMRWWLYNRHIPTKKAHFNQAKLLSRLFTTNFCKTSRALLILAPARQSPTWQIQVLKIVRLYILTNLKHILPQFLPNHRVSIKISQLLTNIFFFIWSDWKRLAAGVPVGKTKLFLLQFVVSVQP